MRFTSRLLCFSFTLACMLPLSPVWADSGNKIGGIGKGPEVTLKSRGKGKRQKLRYAVPRGTKETMQIDMGMTMSMSMGGNTMGDMVMPIMRMRMEVEVTDVDAKGRMRQQFRYTGTELLDTPGVQPMVKASIQQAVSSLQTMQGYAIVDSRGLTLEGGFELGENADPQVAQLTSSLEQSIQQMSSPLPAEAVGVGAEWEVKSQLENNGIVVMQTARYRLKKFTKHGVVCDVSISQTAAKQTIQNPAMPPGSSAELLSMNGRGSGNVRIPLRRLTPTSHAQVASEMDMRMTIAGEDRNMGMKLSLDMKIAPAR